MTFVTKQVRTQELAEYLAECRSHIGLSVPEASLLSGIQPKFIQAIEEGRFTDLPAKVYVKGFLKSLARVYRVSPEPLLEQYQAECTLEANVAAAETSVRPMIGKAIIPRLVLSPKVLTILGISVLGVVSLGYLYFQMSSLRRPPELVIASPVADGVVGTSLLTVSGHAEPGASVFINNQPIVVDTEGNFQENLSLGVGVNQLVVRAVNKFDQETVVNRSIILQQENPAASADTGVSGALPAVSLEVVMQDASAWIRLEADGVEQYSGTMLPSARRVVTAENKIVLSTGNAGATRVFLNGKDLGVLGKTGETLRDIEFAPR